MAKTRADAAALQNAMKLPAAQAASKPSADALAGVVLPTADRCLFADNFIAALSAVPGGGDL